MVIWGPDCARAAKWFRAWQGGKWSSGFYNLNLSICIGSVLLHVRWFEGSMYGIWSLSL